MSSEHIFRFIFFFSFNLRNFNDDERRLTLSCRKKNSTKKRSFNGSDVGAFPCSCTGKCHATKYEMNTTSDGVSFAIGSGHVFFRLLFFHCFCKDNFALFRQLIVANGTLKIVLKVSGTAISLTNFITAPFRLFPEIRRKMPAMGLPPLTAGALTPTQQRV